MRRRGGHPLRDRPGSKLITHHRRWTRIGRSVVLEMCIGRWLRRMLGRLPGIPIEARIVLLLWRLRARRGQHPRSLTRRRAQAVFPRARSFRWHYRIRLIDGAVEGRGGISHSAILHALDLLILELRRVDKVAGGRAHERAGVEHVVGAHVRVVEMVEGRAIVVVDGSGVVHPGAHIRDAGWLPICERGNGCQQLIARHRHESIEPMRKRK